MAKKKEKKENWFKRLFQGRLLNSSFFLNHWMLISLIVVIAISYISTKYTCQIRVSQIMSLTRELNNAKTDCVKSSSEFKSQIRETRMKRLIDTMHIELTSPEQPPYKLTEK